MSLQRINSLAEPQRRQAYAQILPPRLWEHLAAVDPRNLAGGPDDPRTFHLIAPPERAEAHLRIPEHRVDGDFALSLDMEEGGAGQLELSFIIINDLLAPRFKTDVDAQGRLTLLGTAGRNLPEELKAMGAGLGPGQVRKGLRLFHELLPRLEDFARRWGYVAIALEPLTYHNAVSYESHGFGYLMGLKRMKQVNHEFRPGGLLAQLLDDRNPFRMRAFAHNARGRSWAIHDGLLKEFDNRGQLELKMFKVVGQDARQRTFTP